jgi:hypothetical protein
VVEDDDQAAVELLNRLEWQVGDGFGMLADIEEFRKRRGHDTFAVRVKDKSASHERCLIPFLLVDAAFRVAEETQPVMAHVFFHQPLDTEREISANFEQEDGAIRGGRAMSGVVDAYTTAARHATFLRGVDRYQVVWRDGASPVSSGARTRW